MSDSLPSAEQSSRATFTAEDGNAPGDVGQIANLPSASPGQIELQAQRVGQALRRLLTTEGQMQAELREVVEALMSLQTQLREWVELHHLMHEILPTLAPFYAQLISLEDGAFGSADLQALLQDWRPCQESVDRLVDFAEEIEYIGRPFRRQGRELMGERWAVGVVALRLLLEDALKEDDLSLGSLTELTKELDDACHRYLALANCRVKAVMEALRRLLDSFLGGLA